MEQTVAKDVQAQKYYLSVISFLFFSPIVYMCVFAVVLTLDVYLFHLINLRNSLSELLGKLPELVAARGAEAHQLFLL